MLLPEVRAADASPEVRALYDDICSVMDVPFVNLIHRYLATIPGALEYAWSLGREACLDGRLDRWVETIASNGRLEETSAPLHSSLSNEAGAAALRIIDVYNRQNPRNVIVFSALLAMLRRHDLTASDDSPARFPSHDARVESTIPDIPKFSELDDRTQKLLLELASLQGLEGRGLVPSLYLHLAVVPGAIAVAYDAIVQLLRDGIIAKRVHLVRASASSLAGALAPASRTLPRTVYDRRNEIADVVASFTERAIPSMVVIGNVLARRFSSKHSA
ncbi:MAG TPA: hypothetical protein VMD07_06235 [Candidatus Acidoferrales bacterium]|nr:hypothetical protein [Candidatus Acidoferrales bacterium]